MTVSDTILILATIAGPILAVQAQKWIERATERGSAQKRIFFALMATRATRVAPDHVQALNMIDLEFSGSGWRRQTSREREVVNRWRIYADHLNQDVDEADLWNAHGDELFTDLLVALAAALRYSFDRVQLRRGIYYPRAHGEAETRRVVFEKAVVKVFTGESPLSMKITEVPGTEESFELQRNLQVALLDLVKDGRITIKKAS
jgi:hypothetical protein